MTDIREYLVKYYKNANSYNLIKTRDYFGIKYIDICNKIEDIKLKDKFIFEYATLNNEIIFGDGENDIDVFISFLSIIKKIIEII